RRPSTLATRSPWRSPATGTPRPPAGRCRGAPPPTRSRAPPAWVRPRAPPVLRRRCRPRQLPPPADHQRWRLGHRGDLRQQERPDHRRDGVGEHHRRPDPGRPQPGSGRGPPPYFAAGAAPVSFPPPQTINAGDSVTVEISGNRNAQTTGGTVSVSTTAD